MPLPSWLRVGRVVSAGSSAGHVVHIDELDSSFSVQLLDEEAEVRSYTMDDVIDRRVHPHRWMERVEAMIPPFAARVHYRGGGAYEMRPGERPPSFMYDVDDYLVRRPMGDRPFAFYRVLRIRPRQDQVLFAGLLDPMPRRRVAEEFVPHVMPRVEQNARRVGTYIDNAVLDVSCAGNDLAGATVTLQTPTGRVTLPLAEFNLEYDIQPPLELPSWVRVGSHVMSIRTGREDIITAFDTLTGRVDMSVGHVSLDTLLREWFSDEGDGVTRRAENRVGSLWATVNPIALLRVTAQTGAIFERAELEVEIVGNGSKHRLTSIELRARAVAVPETVTLPPGSPCAQWPVGTMWRLADSRYVYVLAQEAREHGVQLVSDAEIAELEYVGLAEEEDEEPVVPLTLLANASQISDAPPASLERYGDQLRRAARSNDAVAETVIDALTIGELRAWSTPPALIEVVDQTSVTVAVRIVPGSRVEEVPRSVFDQRTIALPYRNRLSEELDHPIGTIINGRRGPIAVGESTEGMVLYSTQPLEQDDLDAPPLGDAPETLGYGGRDVEADTISPLAQIAERAVAERAAAMAAAAEVAPVQPAVGQVWAIRFDDTPEAIYRIRRLARDVDAIWVQPVDGGADRPISAGELRHRGSFQADGMDVSSERDEWVETLTKKRCYADKYDLAARCVRVEWLANVTPRTATIPVADFLDRFRCLTSGGRERAVAIRDAPGRPAWARLRRPTTG